MKENLSLIDNDLNSEAGEHISLGLSKNKSLKSLKISENLLKPEGVISIANNAERLHKLYIAKYLPPYIS